MPAKNRTSSSLQAVARQTRQRTARPAARRARGGEAEELRALVEESPVAQAMFGRDLRYLHASRKWRADFGLGDREVRGLPHAGLCAWQPERWESAFQRALAGEPVAMAEEQLYPPGAAPRWVSWEVRPWRRKSGSVGGILVYIGDIAAQKKAEQALDESNGRLAAFFDHASTIMWIKDLHGRFLRINHRTAEALGRPMEDIIGRSVRDLTPSGEADCYAKHDQQVLASGQAMEFAETMARPDGLHSYVSAKFPLRDSAGKVYALGAVCTDISAQQATENALRESEAQFRGFFDNIAVGAAQIDANARFVRVNDRCCDISGYSREELLGGMGPLDLMLPQERRDEREGIKCLAAGLPHRSERSFQRKDGSVCWVHISLSPILDKDGSLQSSAAVIEDITARRTAEEELRRSQALLAKAERLSNTGAAEWDLISDVWTVSDQWRAIHGCSQSRLTSEDLMTLAHPDDRAAIARAFQDLLAGIAPYSIEHRILRQDNGETRIVQAFGELVRDASGKVVKGWGATQDITESRRAESSLRQSEERLRLALQSAGMGPWEWEVSEDRVHVTAETQRLFGLPETQLVCSTADYFRLIHPDDLDRMQQLIRAAIHSHTPYAVEYRIFRADDGTIRWLRSNGRLQSIAANGGKRIIGISQDVTERRLAEENLRISEERLRLAQQVARIGAFDFNAVTGQSTWTPELEALHGLGPGQFAGTHQAWEELLHPEDKAFAMSLNVRALATGEPMEGEWRVQWPDGTVRWLYGRFRGIKDDSGRVVRLTGVNLDITDRKLAEAALRDAHERLELVITGAGAAIWDWDLRSGNVNYSARWKALHGFDSEEPSGSLAERLERIHPDDQARVQASLQAHLEGQTSSFAELYRTRHLNGSWIWVADRGMVRRDGEGMPLRMTGAEVDVTALRQAEEIVREREARLSAILNTVADAVITIGQDSTILTANPAAEQMFGYRESEMVGRNVRLLMPESYREEHESYVAQWPAPSLTRHGAGREVMGIRKDGTEFPIEVAVSAVPEMRIFTGIIRDISNRKELESQVLRASENERQRVAADLHDGVCQDLIAASCTAKGLQTQLLKQGNGLAAQAGQLADALSQAAAQTRLIARGMSPVVSGGPGLMDALQELAARTTHTYQLRCQLECRPAVSGIDSFVGMQLYLIAQEAVRNAVSHSRAQQIDINFSQSASEIRLSVSDNGCGFSPQAISGSGFGLRGMRYRASLMRGRISIERRRQGGTRVICRIPKLTR